jgi:uncharacterized membrane protein
MTAFPPSTAAAAEPRPAVRRIGVGDIRWALAKGWQDYNAKRGDVVIVAVLYPLMGFVAAVAAMNANFVPLLLPLLAGLSILGPAVASGFYELARRRDEGLDDGWVHFFAPLFSRRVVGLAVMTAALLVLFLAWLWVAWAIYVETLGALRPTDAADFLAKLLRTSQGWDLILIGNLAGLAFAAVVLVVSFVAFPMLVDRPVDPLTAVGTSLRAFAQNPITVLIWGLTVAVLLVVGALAAFIGLAVVLPVVGYATWHLYTRVVAR